MYKEAVVAILIPDKTKGKRKSTLEKKGTFILIKTLMYQEDTAILNVYLSNNSFNT